MTIYKGQIPIAGLTSPIAPTKSMGQIVESKIPLVDAGLHLLDGTLVRGDGVYKVFVDKMADLYTLDPTAEYFCTQEDWEDSVFNYGVCEKFVYDSTYNTVRLPKMYSNIRYLIKSHDDGTNWYRIYSDGWCEQGGYVTVSTSTGEYTYNLTKEFTDTNYSITGQFASYYSSDFSSNRAIYPYTKAQFKIRTASTVGGLQSWIASGYTDISDYKKVPNYLYIVLATASKNQEDLDVDMVMTELNGKVDVSDLVSAHVVVEAYSNGTSWYRLYDDGWCEQGGIINASSDAAYTYTLLKPYIDTNYQVFITRKTTGDYNTAINGRWGEVYNVTRTAFTTWGKYSNYPEIYWQACGYADLSS